MSNMEMACRLRIADAYTCACVTVAGPIQANLKWAIFWRYARAIGVRDIPLHGRVHLDFT